jgi:hypothetical protein
VTYPEKEDAMTDRDRLAEALDRFEVASPESFDDVRGVFIAPATLDDILEVFDAARRVLSARPPDYEAALTEYLRLRWAKDGVGPYAEELAAEVLENGVMVPRISNFEEAKRIVDASLGGSDKLILDPEET